MMHSCRGSSIEGNCHQASLAGSYASTVPRERCGWRGRMTGALASDTGPAPPITYTFPPTTAATPPPRGVGMAANARQPSVAGSYSHASLTGFQPGGPAAGRSKPPNRNIFQFKAVTGAWWTGCGIGFVCVHASPRESCSYTEPPGLKPGGRSWPAYGFAF